jgi:hypothetical protein
MHDEVSGVEFAEIFGIFLGVLQNFVKRANKFCRKIMTRAFVFIVVRIIS